MKVPYDFIDEAVQSARRVVPRKNRKDVLLNRLDQQTKELDMLKQKSDIVAALIKEKTPTPEPPATAPDTPAAAPADANTKEKPVEQASDEQALRDEIIRLQEQLEVSYSIYAQEQGIVLGDMTKIEPPTDPKGAKWYKELGEVKGALVKLIDEEMGIEAQEKGILEKRVQEADKLLPTITSKALSQDVVSEKERIAQRLADLETRRDFLSKEKERFSTKS